MDKDKVKPAHESGNDTSGETARPDLRRQRRRFLGDMSRGSALVAGAAATGPWIKPVVEHVVLPAHAQTTLVRAFFARAAVSGNEFDSNAASGLTDGSHSILADNSDFDNLGIQFAAQFHPNGNEAIPVTVTINQDGSGDYDLNTGSFGTSTLTAQRPDSPAEDQGVVVELEGDGDANVANPVIVNATFAAPGFPTRRIQITVTS